MSMSRAYSLLSLKAVNEDKRILTGIATTPETDRMGDVVEPKGAEFKLPIPFLWQHDSGQPIGHVTKAKVTNEGIEVEVQIAKIEQPGKLKDRVDEAWDTIKAGLVRGLSIGFSATETARIEGTYGLRFIKWLWLELSAVTIAANGGASIQTIKSADQALLAASGRGQGRADGVDPPPGVSGTQQRPASGGFFHSRKENTVKTLQELLEARNTKAARMNELVELRNTEKRKFTDAEASEFDTLETEMGDLDDEIRIKRFEDRQAASATAVKGNNSESASRSRGGMSFVKKTDPDERYKGQGFTRMAIAKALSFMAMKDGNFVSPAEIAQHRWGKSHPNLVNYIKTAVAGGGTGSGEWGAELAQSSVNYNGDFIEYLYSQTVFDRLPLRSVPARVHIKGQDGAATGYWTGESKAIAVSKPDFSDVELTPLKVGAIAVCSKELIADSDPSAEMWIRDSIVQASSQRVDTTFLSTTAASSGVSPAGLLNGLTAKVPSGTDSAAVRADLMTMYADFIAAKNASGLVQVMNPALAKALSLMVNSLGQIEFPGLNATGGTLLGDPVYTGDNVTGGYWLLLKPSDIWKIGDGGIELSMSDSAMIEQNDAPQAAGDTPTAASATLMSLWQTEQVGFKLVRRINYAKRRSGAVVYLDNAEYGGVVS